VTVGPADESESVELLVLTEVIVLLDTLETVSDEDEPE
jgi:hypothetical protein